jgi:hypothetical protein
MLATVAAVSRDPVDLFLEKLISTSELPAPKCREQREDAEMLGF